MTCRWSSQVSRWDRLKDPVGVLQGFAEHVHAETRTAHLVLAGPDVDAVADDPEGAEVLAEVEAVWRDLPRDVRRHASTSHCSRWTTPTRTP